MKIPSNLVDAIQPGAFVVSGSRVWLDFTPMRIKAIEIVREAIASDRSIIVGDAEGFDLETIRAAINMDYDDRLIVLGCHAVGRFRLPVPDAALSWLVPGGDRRGSCYLIRDRAMAELAASGFLSVFRGVWNGISRGTIKTALEAYKLGMEGVLFRPLIETHIRLSDMFWNVPREVDVDTES